MPPEELPGALSLNFSAFQAAMIGGPAIAGLILAGHAGATAMGARLPAAGTPVNTAGLSLIYLVNALSFLAMIFALVTMRTSGAPEKGSQDAHPWAALKEGLRFVFTTALMVWTMGLDFLATFFSGSMLLLPIFADQVRSGPRSLPLRLDRGRRHRLRRLGRPRHRPRRRPRRRRRAGLT